MTIEALLIFIATHTEILVELFHLIQNGGKSPAEVLKLLKDAQTTAADAEIAAELAQLEAEAAANSPATDPAPAPESEPEAPAAPTGRKRKAAPEA